MLSMSRRELAATLASILGTTFVLIFGGWTFLWGIAATGVRILMVIVTSLALLATWVLGFRVYGWGEQATSIKPEGLFGVRLAGCSGMFLGIFVILSAMAFYFTLNMLIIVTGPLFFG